eukprot:9080255-Pyramimonas_sp.AAC.1
MGTLLALKPGTEMKTRTTRATRQVMLPSYLRAQATCFAILSLENAGEVRSEKSPTPDARGETGGYYGQTELKHHEVAAAVVAAGACHSKDQVRAHLES